jgi:hypothetical protein
VEKGVFLCKKSMRSKVSTFRRSTSFKKARPEPLSTPPEWGETLRIPSATSLKNYNLIFSPTSLERIDGLPEARRNQIGSDILDTIQKFCTEKKISSDCIKCLQVGPIYFHKIKIV